jgi:hypothetical protein
LFFAWRFRWRIVQLGRAFPGQDFGACRAYWKAFIERLYFSATSIASCHVCPFDRSQTIKAFLGPLCLSIWGNEKKSLNCSKPLLLCHGSDRQHHRTDLGQEKTERLRASVTAPSNLLFTSDGHTSVIRVKPPFTIAYRLSTPSPHP